jgi:hypothetical protein
MHPVLQELFDTMLDERLKNIECAPSYELYDIDGDIGALMDAVNYYYSDVAVKPIERLVKRYSEEGKTMGQLRAKVVDKIDKLQVPEKDIVNKIPVNYKEDRSLKKTVTYLEELSWKMTCYTKDYDAVKTFVEPIVKTISEKTAWELFYLSTSKIPDDKIIDDALKADLLVTAKSIGMSLEADAYSWLEECQIKEINATQIIVAAHEKEIEDFRNRQKALEERLAYYEEEEIDEER